MRIVLFSPEIWRVKDQYFDLAINQVIRLQGGESNFSSIVKNRPDLVIFSGFDLNQNFSRQLSAVAAELPQAILVIHQASPDSRSVIELMRAGAREIITDDSPAAISEMLQRLDARTKAKLGSGATASRCIGFLSAKGGDGSTFVTANAAAALAKDENIRVLLLDLSLPFGDLEMYVSSDPLSHDISDVVSEVERMDEALLQSMSSSVKDNFKIIPAATVFEKVLRINADGVKRLLKTAQAYFDFVLIDLGSGVDPVTVRLMEALNEVVLVATASLPSIKRTGQILSLWNSLEYPDEKLSLVINKYNSRDDVKISEFEKAIHKSVSQVLPNVPDLVRGSLRAGMPLVERMPRSKIAGEIFHWVAKWNIQADKERSIWRKIFGKN